MLGRFSTQALSKSWLKLQNGLLFSPNSAPSRHSDRSRKRRGGARKWSDIQSDLQMFPSVRLCSMLELDTNASRTTLEAWYQPGPHLYDIMFWTNAPNKWLPYQMSQGWIVHYRAQYSFLMTQDFTVHAREKNVGLEQGEGSQLIPTCNVYHQ